MNFYNIHLQSIGELDEQSYASKFTELSLYLNHWPDDDLFQTNEIFFVTKRLANKLLERGDLTGFILSNPITAKPDLIWAQKNNGFDTDQYCRLTITGNDAATDFVLYNHIHLIVSEKALAFLNANHVIYSIRTDLIDIPWDQYFHSARYL